MANALTDLHNQAVDLYSRGEAAEALELLRGAVRDAVDLDVLNDLAVMMASAGDAPGARELLVALRHVDPGHTGAEENLAALGPVAAERADVRAAAPQTEARARFLQVVAEGIGTHLPDNVDHFFHPWGHPLPEQADAGARIAEQLAVLDACGAFWRGAGDENSRELFLRFLAYRALGAAHVRLELEPREYRLVVQALSARMLLQANVFGGAGMPLEWKFSVYDLARVGYSLNVIGQPLPLASTFCFSQYGYRDESVLARPLAGDVVLDVGGCWGETALWFADRVGAAGRVHVFEPTPANREILAKNLELNPGHAERIATWDRPLAAAPGETVFIPNAVAAGATVRTERDHERPMCELRTDTVDAMVARGEIERVDFLKIDVEGADLSVLEGAAESIRSFRPRLAVAAYHKPDDLARIPDFVESLGVGYRWYLQCSTMTDVDTVAFAVPVD